MKITPRSRRQLLVQNVVFVVLLLTGVGVAAWLSTQYDYQADWTFGNRNSLSPASVKLLDTLKQPVTAIAYAGEASPFRGPLQRFFRNYQKVKPDFTLSFVDPDRDPEAARRAGITADGQVVLSYGDRSEKLARVSEAEVANALERLVRSGERFVVFLKGDGERDPLGEHNFDLGAFGKQLAAKGFKIEPLSLAANPSIPQNTAVLVIAGPQAPVLPGMVKLIRDYVRRGGNLLWLGDPGPLYGLEPLAADLGVRFGAGTIVDPNTQMLGINDPTITLVSEYPATSALTQGLTAVTLFPTATSVQVDKSGRWDEDDFLKSLPRSWLETGKLQGSVSFDPKQGDKAGPLTLGVALTREATPGHEQRVVITGDGDFLSDAYVSNVGNMDLGLDIMNWVAHDDAFLDINPRPAPDLVLSLTPAAQGAIGISFLFALPLAFLIAGLTVWLRRRRR
ncbi:MAG TPA: GldG family protein [Gammaproteobacteria bacterium]|nr:GldG family protein [Gammaproteobacteria bacterium]